MRRNGTSVSGNRFTFYTNSLTDLIGFAYGVRPLQMSFATGASSLDGIRYDIEAKAEGHAGRTAAEFKLMTRELLAKRLDFVSTKK